MAAPSLGAFEIAAFLLGAGFASALTLVSVAANVLSARSSVAAHAQGRSTHLLDAIGSASFERRHGEWLAITTALWILGHWDHEHSARLVRSYGGRRAALERLRSLAAPDAAFQPPDVARSVRKALRGRH